MGTSLDKTLRRVSERSALRDVNLNLLPVLYELLRTKSVTGTAHAIGLSQSTVSGALRKLRRTLDDELLIASGRAFELTPRATVLRRTLGPLLEDLGGLVFSKAFPESVASWRFQVATVDYVDCILGPPLARSLAKKAPHVSIQFLEAHGGSLEDLDRGTVDLLIAPRQLVDGILAARPFAERLERRVLWYDELVGIVAEGSGLDASCPAAFAAAPRIHVRLPGAGSGEAETPDDARFLTSSYLAVPGIVATTDCAALVPSNLQPFFGRSDLRVFPPPVPDTSLRLEMVWLQRSRSSNSHRWLRQHVMDAVTTSCQLLDD